MLEKQSDKIILHRVPIRLMLVLASLCIPLGVYALSPGLDAVLRYTVMESSHIVVGRVIENLPYNQTLQNRRSVIIVDEVLYGSSSVGDSMTVHWKANEWYPREGAISVVMCEGFTQLDTLLDKTALWLLGGSGELMCTGRPIQYKLETKGRLIDYIAYVEEPDTTNIGIATMLRLHAELASKHESLAKCAAFTAFLRRCVQEQ